MVESGAARGDDRSMDDHEQLRALNDQFIDAWRHASWPELQRVLAADFCYIDGTSGEMWSETRYRQDLEASAAPSLSIDQVVVHVAGDTAAVSARTHNGARRPNRYLDVYS